MFSITELLDFKIHFTAQWQLPHETLVKRGSVYSFCFNIGETDSTVLGCNHLGFRELAYELPGILDILEIFRRVNDRCATGFTDGQVDPLHGDMARLGIKPTWLQRALQKFPPNMICALYRLPETSNFQTFKYPHFTSAQVVSSNVRSAVGQIHQCISLYVAYGGVEQSDPSGGTKLCTCMLNRLVQDDHFVAERKWYNLGVARCELMNLKNEQQRNANASNDESKQSDQQEAHRKFQDKVAAVRSAALAHSAAIEVWLVQSGEIPAASEPSGMDLA